MQEKIIRRRKMKYKSMNTTVGTMKWTMVSTATATNKANIYMAGRKRRRHRKINFHLLFDKVVNLVDN